VPGVVHFEIPVDDLDRAKTFYRAVFGWDLETIPMPGMGGYTTVVTTPVDPDTQQPAEAGAINGGMTERGPSTPTPVITVDVESIDAALRNVESAGGHLVTPRTEIPGMGAFAYFADSEGNVTGLWESA
jgi:predicted enzyme related to lactoylglutathione lyase